VKGWNPDLQIEALDKGVGVTSEDFFDHEFWTSKDLCWNALDNVVARKYTDSCCLWFKLPLLESGTLGTKSNGDVFLPNQTKSYNDGKENDANETQIAMCTLRSFPYLPIHCIEYAKQAYFSDYMEFAPTQYEVFRKDVAGFFEQLDAMGEAEQFKALSMIKEFIALQQQGAVDFPACVRTAFGVYRRDFITSIKDLVHQCDEMQATTGKPFWTGTKRRPIAGKWDAKAPPPEALEFLYATANCFAFIWKIPPFRNRAEFEKLVISMDLQLPEWTPPGGEAKKDLESEEAEKVDPEQIEKLKGELYAVDTKALLPLESHDFEKDDDSNFHIDFLTVATNMRSSNYDIKLSERAHVKVTAGRIIPALATTTAMICGLVDIEFLKIVKGLHKEKNSLDLFYNANINLATGSQAINVFRPEPAIKLESKLEKLPEFTSWDSVEIQGETTLKLLVEDIQNKFGCTIKSLHPAADEKATIFELIQIKKQTWKIEFSEDGKVVIEPEEVFTSWPQLRMAAQMYARVAAGPARTNFENQIKSCQKALQAVKDTFAATFAGPVSEAYVKACRPEDEEKRKYFDAVFAKRPYIALRAQLWNSTGEDAELPLIKYLRR